MTNARCFASRVLRSSRMSKPDNRRSLHGVPPRARGAARHGQLAWVRQRVATLAAGLRAAFDPRGYRTGVWCRASGWSADRTQPVSSEGVPGLPEPGRYRPALQSLAAAAAARAGRPTCGVRPAAHRVAVSVVSQRLRAAREVSRRPGAAALGVYPSQISGKVGLVDHAGGCCVHPGFRKVLNLGGRRPEIKRIKARGSAWAA